MKSQNPKIKNGKIIAVSISKNKGTKKCNVDVAELKENHGILDDAHAGAEKRQVSLLALESIEKIRAKGLNVTPGDFAENITTKGIDLMKLKIGSKLKIGKGAVLKVTQLGKECHSRCGIYYHTGDCVMPREGIFARVLKGGIIRPRDRIILLS